MKFARFLVLGLLLAAPSALLAAPYNATVDEITFQWENAMTLAAADPCASYMSPTYYSGGHEGHYDDDGNDLRY